MKQNTVTIKWLEHKLDQQNVNKKRKELLKNAYGQVLEVGMNFESCIPYFTDDVRHVTAITKEHKMNPYSEQAVTVICGSELSLPFADGIFDTVVSHFQLGLTSNPEQVLTEMRRVLKPHGRLLAMELGGITNKYVDKVNDKVSKVISYTGGIYRNRNYIELIRDAGFLIAEKTILDTRINPKLLYGQLYTIIAVNN